MTRFSRSINVMLTGIETGAALMFVLACLRFHALTSPFVGLWTLEGAVAGAFMGLLVAWMSRELHAIVHAQEELAIVPAREARVELPQSALEMARQMVALYGRDAAAKAILEADDTMDQGNVVDFKQWLKTVDCIRQLQRDTRVAA